jgi:hypothetical protein
MTIDLGVLFIEAAPALFDDEEAFCGRRWVRFLTRALAMMGYMVSKPQKKLSKEG